MASLTPDEVRAYIRDVPSENHLLDGEEFSDFDITFAMKLAIDDYNMMPPMSALIMDSFPSISILLSGTLYKMFAGRSALLARNTMNYSDGGLQVPVEERMALYAQLAAMYQADFTTNSRNLKTHLNIESGWSAASSDYATFPLY